MKVLHLIAGDLTGGAAKGAYWLHLALLEKNIDSYIVTNSIEDYKSPKINALSKKFINRVNFSFFSRIFKFLEYRYFKRKKIIFNTGFDGIDITRLKLYKKADIIHLHWINGLVRVSSLSKVNKPIIWTLRDMWPMTGGCHYSGINDCDNYKTGCGSCPQLASNNKHDLSYYILRNKLKYLPNNIYLVGLSSWISQCAKESKIFKNSFNFTIGNNINTELFYQEDKQISKKKFNLPSDKKIILIGAQNINDFYKGLDLFLKASGEVKTKNVQIVTFGNSDYAYNDTYKFINLGFIRDISQLRAVYSSADVFIAPSRMESFGKTIAESMACGTPAVIFGGSGSEDVITHKVDGYIAKPFDIFDMAIGIDWILNNNDHQQLSKRSVSKIKSTFDSKIIANKYINLYENILRKNYTN